jgi:hypothetical protein
MTNLIWLHEDALRADHPVFLAAGGSAPSVFVWDEAYWRECGYSFKRLVFLYETLCELPCAIYRGPMRQTLLDLIAKHGALALFVPETPNPALQEVIAALAGHTSVTIVPDEPFVLLKKEPRLSRFFNYWKSAEKLAFTPGGGADAGGR